MAATLPLTLEAADAVFAADRAVRRARNTVEDLHAAVTSLLRVLDDAELDSAKARLSDRGDFYLASAGEHLDRLRSLCADLPTSCVELDNHLNQASDALTAAEGLVAKLDTGHPEVRAEVAELMPRIAVLGEMLELAPPMAHITVQHVQRAREVSREVTAPHLLEPRTLERSIHAAGSELGRADEDVRLLEDVVDRAATTAHQSANVASEISDTARQRLAQHQHHPSSGDPSTTPGVAAVAPRI